MSPELEKQLDDIAKQGEQNGRLAERLAITSWLERWSDKTDGDLKRTLQAVALDIINQRHIDPALRVMPVKIVA